MNTLSKQLLSNIVQEHDSELLTDYLSSIDAHTMAREVCELSDDHQTALLSILEPEAAVEVLGDIPEIERIEALSHLSPQVAAAIVHEFPSNEQADVVGALDDDEADAILAAMEPEEAQQLYQLSSYPADTAGGLMVTEVMAFHKSAKSSHVLKHLQKQSHRLKQLDVQYAYVVEDSQKLFGVLRLRDLLLADNDISVADLVKNHLVAVNANTCLEQLREIFDTHNYLGVPVTDKNGILLGVVSRTAVDEATQDKVASDFRRSLGLVEEEIRTMPILRRSRSRLTWLSLNIVLNVLAASVIAYYQETLSKVIALAIFLPMISDMSGCSGSQAVAVSMRELSLGLLEPYELLRVWLKEMSVGILNGLAIGGLLGSIAWAFSGNIWLFFVIFITLAINTVIAVIIGGSLPLILKRCNVDPALASGPILTTITDMLGFFLVLSIATLMLPKLVIS